jgi:NAD(P)H-hydrate epimerase
MHVLTVAEMQRCDTETIHTVGVPAMVLMERAAWAACQLLQHRRPDFVSRSTSVLVLAGSGNNGGDALALARMLHLAGHHLTVAAMPPKTPAAQAQTQILQHLGVAVTVLGPQRPEPRWADLADGLIIDGLFGVGLNRPLDDWLVHLVDAINRQGSDLLALDVPSGLHGDTGVPHPTAVQATWTVGFGYPKTGLLTDAAADHVGELWVADIGLDPRPVSAVQRRVRPVGDGLPTEFDCRIADSHKGDFGRVLLIGGSPTMPGAILLATAGALAAGPGYVTVALPENLIPTAATRFPAAMFQPLPGASQPTLSALLEKASVVAIGPGLGLSPAASHLVEQVLADAAMPVILDADALTLAAAHPEWVRQRTAPTILTPHAGEAGRWLNVTSEEVQADRWGALERLIGLTGATVVLKGARTLVGTPGGAVTVTTSGSPALARGGSGDVLTGLIAGLTAQRPAQMDRAVEAAVCWHGTAAGIAAAAHGMLSATWERLIEAMPAALRQETIPSPLPGLTRLIEPVTGLGWAGARGSSCGNAAPGPPRNRR